MYVLAAVLVAVPVVLITGYVHFKRIGARGSETDSQRFKV